MQTFTAQQPFTGIGIGEHDRSNGAVWTGRILSSFAVLFLTLDAVAKLLQLQPVIDGTTQLGYTADVIVPLGMTLLSCVVLYVYPRTAPVGALLLTGYLGGAVATHVRVGNPLFTHILAPTYFAAFIWGGLVLRDPRLRVLLPWYDRSRV
jgi:DoxX-like protein